MTNREIVDKVLSQSSHLGQEVEGLYAPDIVGLIPETIREIVQDTSMSGMQGDRKLLQKDFTVVITTQAGFDTGDLTTVLAASEPLFLHLPFSSVVHSSSQAGELFYCADVRNLGFVELQDGVDYYSVDGKTIYINASPELTGNLTVHSFYVPSITNLDNKFKADLVNRLLMKFGTTRMMKR